MELRAWAKCVDNSFTAVIVFIERDNTASSRFEFFKGLQHVYHTFIRIYKGNKLSIHKSHISHNVTGSALSPYVSRLSSNVTLSPLS